ncbi:MAG: four helix bundle protein [Myxococcota bacterium]
MNNIAESAGEFLPNEKARFYRIALRSSTECAAALHTCQRRNLAEVDGIEAGRVLLKRVVEMLTRLILSTARRQIPVRDRERDHDRDRVGAEDSP